MTNETHSTIVNEVLIEFLSNLGKNKEGQLKTKLLVSANLLTAVNGYFHTPEEFFSAIPYSVEGDIWGQLIELINLIMNDETSRSPYYYDKIFLMAMFIAQEVVLGVSGYKLQKLHTFRHIDRAVDEVLANKLDDETLEIDEDLSGNLEFFQNRRAIELINYRFQNKDFQAFLKYKESKDEAEKKIKEYSENITTKQQEITVYLDDKQIKVQSFSDKLDDLKSGYNFVLLNKGFENLLDKKEKRVSKLTKSLIVMALLIVGFFVYNVYCNQSDNISWGKIAVSVGLELILIYFFRVMLLEYNSLKTQIMQLELRVSLCQFIQDYAKYAKEIKQDDKEALEKFENVVFSNILANDKDLPSTFDGAEQMGNFIKSIKG